MKKILIIEDDEELAENIKEILGHLGYQVSGILTHPADVLDTLSQDDIDLILIDICLHGKIEGIEIARSIRESNSDVPIVFSTALSEDSILNQISSIQHNGYLLKPYSTERLRSALYLAFEQQALPLGNAKNCLKIKDKNHRLLIPVDQVIFLEADGMYTKVHTVDRTYTVRDILKDVIGDVWNRKLVRVHKSFAVNIDHVSSFNAKEIIVDKHAIPIRRGFGKELKRIFEP